MLYVKGALLPEDERSVVGSRKATAYGREVAAGLARDLAVSGVLMMMELKGLVKQVGEMNYIRVREAVAGYGS